jgi:inner membrane protein
MEPITHFMTGACLARAGFNRKAAYATLAMTLAAEAPDLDTLWAAGGPVAAFQHHRGITHTLIGLPLDGLVVMGVVWLAHRWRMHRAANKPAAARPDADPGTDQQLVRPFTSAPVRWGMLYGFVLIALLSHILLDWTNNYGVRPFFPFNPHWYAGSFVFIFEPVIWLVLLVGLIAPALFGLIGGEVGARKQVFHGRGWAIFALAAIVGLWGWRWVEHDAAVQLASAAAYGPDSTGAEVSRVTASPYPVNPYRWHTVAETPNFFQIGSVDSFKGTLTTNPEQDLFFKPAETPATLAAKASRLGKAYLDWSSWALVTDIGPTTPADDAPGAANWTAVSFRDLRFMYDTSMMQGRTNPPLSAIAYVDANGHVVRMEMGKNVQR